MGNVLVNPSLGQTMTVNPTLGQTQKLYSGGSNTCLKYLPQGGPTPTLIRDLSGRGYNAAFTTAPEPILVNGKWCYQFVSGSLEYCLVPDIVPLLGATAATWCAYVRKDAYVSGGTLASDFRNTDTHRKWSLSESGTDGTFAYTVGNGTATVAASCTGYSTGAWHFVWMRYTGNSATGLEAGVDATVATPVSTTTVTALGSTGAQAHTYIGMQYSGAWASMTLGALTIWPRAITDAELSQWRWDMKAKLGL